MYSDFDSNRNFSRIPSNDVYAKYQSLDGRSSASSNASTASSQESCQPHKTSVSHMSRQVLANTIQKNVCEQTHQMQLPTLDDSLTNLNWLYNVNPIKINQQLCNNGYMTTGFPKDKPLTQYSPNRQRNNKNTILTNLGVPNHRPSGSPLTSELLPPLPPLLISSTTDSNYLHQQHYKDLSSSTNHPDYSTNPIKPPFNYATLISWAMRDINKPKITLADIYSWIQHNFAYYRHSDLSWQNSVRHNLSLGKCFEKVPRRKDEPGKGGFWRISPQYSRTLDSNLSKIPYKPNSRLAEKFNTVEYQLSPTQYQQSFDNSFLNLESINFQTDHPVKKSRKSPLTVTPEFWDNNNNEQLKSSIIELPRETESNFIFRNIPGTQFFDYNTNTYRQSQDFSKIPNSVLDAQVDNSSDSTFRSFDTLEDDIDLMEGLGDVHGLEDIFGDQMLLDRDDLGVIEEVPVDNDEIHCKSHINFNEYPDFFFNSKDVTMDLNNMLDIPQA